MKLCYLNDCKAGEHRLSLCCADCDIGDCPERCRKQDLDECKWREEYEPSCENNGMQHNKAV